VVGVESGGAGVVPVPGGCGYRDLDGIKDRSVRKRELLLSLQCFSEPAAASRGRPVPDEAKGRTCKSPSARKPLCIGEALSQLMRTTRSGMEPRQCSLIRVAPEGWVWGQAKQGKNERLLIVEVDQDGFPRSRE
jgi:hypothetical protein